LLGDPTSLSGGRPPRRVVVVTYGDYPQDAYDRYNRINSVIIYRERNLA
jgi:hypothetical protein